MLPDSNGEDSSSEQQKPGWLSSRWADRGNDILGDDEIDASIRCETSGICEGAGSCPPGVSLISVTNDTEDFLLVTRDRSCPAMMLWSIECARC